MKKQIVLASLALILVMFSSRADWPQYLGPHRNSTSDETGILRAWPEAGPETLWTVPVGIGFGGPVVKDGKVYLLDRNAEVGDTMRCLDLSTGEKLWDFAYDAPGAVMFPGSRSVPIVDGNHVYSCGGFGDLYCIDINTHKPVWNKNVWTDFGGEPPSDEGGFGSSGFPIWGITQNPLIYGDLLILASQAPEAGVVAYNKLTGDVVWKTPNLGNETYVSPTVVKIDGEDHVVMITSSTNPIGRPNLPRTAGNVVGIEPRTGKILWKYDQWRCHISVPSAVDAGSNKVVIVGGYELGATMIQVGKKDDGSFGTTELFTTEEFGDQTKPPILHEGHFYAQYGANTRRDGMVCMSMDGKITWKTKRSPNFDKGSMILVNGLILATDGKRALYLIEPDPNAFKALASAEVLGKERTGLKEDSIERRVGGQTQNWAPLALSDGKLLIRDQTQMKCLKVAE